MKQQEVTQQKENEEKERQIDSVIEGETIKTIKVSKTMKKAKIDFIRNYFIY